MEGRLLLLLLALSVFQSFHSFDCLRYWTRSFSRNYYSSFIKTRLRLSSAHLVPLSWGTLNIFIPSLLFSIDLQFNLQPFNWLPNPAPWQIEVNSTVPSKSKKKFERFLAPFAESATVCNPGLIKRRPEARPSITSTICPSPQMMDTWARCKKIHHLLFWSNFRFNK